MHQLVHRMQLSFMTFIKRFKATVTDSHPFQCVDWAFIQKAYATLVHFLYNRPDGCFHCQRACGRVCEEARASGWCEAVLTRQLASVLVAQLD